MQGDFVGAGEHVRGDAFMRQASGLRQQALVVSGGAVCTQNAYYGSNANLRQLAEVDFRCTAVGSGFTAAADDVYVLVNITWDCLALLGIKNLAV